MSTSSTRRRLRSGHRVQVRPLDRADAPRLARMWDELSEQSRYRRFSTLSAELPERTLTFLTDIDHHDHDALAAIAPGGDIVGVARFVRSADEPDLADLAVTVVDSWQRRGLGTLLIEQLSERAAAVGVTSFTADILAENTPMIGLVRQAGSASVDRSGGGTVVARMDVGERTE